MYPEAYETKIIQCGLARSSNPWPQGIFKSQAFWPVDWRFYMYYISWHLLQTHTIDSITASIKLVILTQVTYTPNLFSKRLRESHIIQMSLPVLASKRIVYWDNILWFFFSPFEYAVITCVLLCVLLVVVDWVFCLLYVKDTRTLSNTLTRMCVHKQNSQSKDSVK